MVNILEAEYRVSNLGKFDSEMVDIVADATLFIAACHVSKIMCQRSEKTIFST